MFPFEGIQLKVEASKLALGAATYPLLHHAAEVENPTILQISRRSGCFSFSF